MQLPKFQRTFHSSSITDNRIRRNVNRGALILALLVLLACALGAFGIGFYNAAQVRQAQDWPTTTGRVFRSQVGIARGQDGEAYAPDIAYRYKVAGTEYQGVRLTLEPWASETSDREKVSHAVSRYPVGETVTVIYNPDRPEVSALERPTSATSWPFVIGSSLLIPFVLLLWLWRRGSLATLIDRGHVSVNRSFVYDTPYAPDTTPSGSPTWIETTETVTEVPPGRESDAPRQQGFNLVKLVPLAFLVVCGTFALSMWQQASAEDRKVVAARQSWQSTEGRIVSSEILAPEANQYRPNVVYEYQLADHSYRNDRISLGESSFTTSDNTAVAEEVARYVPGSSVTVYYDPEQPRQSALELQSHSTRDFRIISFILGGVALLSLLALPVTLRS